MQVPVSILVPAAQPVVTAGAYVSGQCVGGKLSFDISAFKYGQGVFLQSVTLVDQAKQSALMDLILFDSNPSNTTFTDNSTLDIADADMITMIGIVPISSYATFNDNCAAFAGNLALPLLVSKASATPTLYATLVSRGTPTFAAVTDVSIRLGMVSP